jgi:hypothetical protein
MMEEEDMEEEDMGGVGAVAEAVNLVLSEVGHGFHHLSPACRDALNQLEAQNPPAWAVKPVEINQ